MENLLVFTSQVKSDQKQVSVDLLVAVGYGPGQSISRTARNDA